MEADKEGLVILVIWFSSGRVSRSPAFFCGQPKKIQSNYQGSESLQSERPQLIILGTLLVNSLPPPVVIKGAAEIVDLFCITKRAVSGGGNFRRKG